MKKLFLLCVTAVLLFACTSPTGKKAISPIAEQDKRAIIEKIMDEQEQAWNSGSLEEYMQAYVKSDSLLFIGSRGLSYGWQTTLSNYQKSYPDGEAMGTLQFENLEYKDLGESYSFIIGRWYLYRTADTLSGSYSLLWQWNGKTPKIIADHSS